MAKKKNDAVNPDFADMENPTFFDSVDEMKESGLIDDGVEYCDEVTPQERQARLEGGTFGKTHGEAKANSRFEAESNVLTAAGDSLAENEEKCDSAEELVELIIPFDHTTGAQQVKFSINLKEFVIAVGEPVMVPKYVRDYWVSMSRQKFEFDMQRRAFESNDE